MPSSTAFAATSVPNHLRPRGWAALACAAIASPTFLAFNAPPSATFLNQAAALIGWGAWLTLLLATVPRRAWAAGTGLCALLGAFALLTLAALASPLWTHLPWSLSLSGAGALLAATLVALAGAAMQRAGSGVPAFRAFCIALVVAGLGSSLIGILQVFVPQWTDGDWIARTSLAGRAVGNLRQPNHLSSLLLWGVIAAVWLGEARVLRRPVTWGVASLFIFVIVLSASRTGALGMFMLALWGLADKRLSPSARRLLWLAPVAYGLFWWGNSAWADYSHHVFGGETRFNASSDVSSSRFGIWSNTLALIKAHPWVGVGFGEFNFAWTLTPFPHRPVAFFDHTHSLPLQLAVELGVPLALLVLGLLGWAVVVALRHAIAAGRADARHEPPVLRAAFMIVFMVLVHSLLEYPLWYVYFLFPTAFALGLCLSRPAAMSAPEGKSSARRDERTRPLLVASMLMLCAGLASVSDYHRVVIIFAPPNDAKSLAQRIQDGRRSWLFAHHADYAAATAGETSPDGLRPFLRAPHYLLDARLLEAWARALDQAGDVERARYVAQRLKEFRNDQSAEFFEPCDLPAEPGEALPFQCVPPGRDFGYEDFR